MSVPSLLPSILSLVSTVIIALVGWGFRSTIIGLRNDINKNGDRIDKLETSFNDLKSDLPLIYVLREDFVRTLNNVEKRIEGMDGKLDRLLEKTAKGGKTDG